jgi:hypothetical protein
MNRAASILLLCLLFVCPASVHAQATTSAQTSPAAVTTSTGTVISSTRTTLVIRTDVGDYKLFELNSGSTRPAQIPVGATVSVTSLAPDANGVSVATFIRVTAQPPAQAPAAQGAKPTPPSEPVPTEVRRLESSIKRQTARYRMGVRAGVGLDPELIMIGGQALIGPFFSENMWARPNVEFGFGEVTDLIALNFEAIYRVPVTDRSSRWAFFFGAGPALNFVKLGFATEGEQADEDFSFDDFDLDVGLNVIGGVQSRGGMFLELKATAYASPSMRFLVGYSF